jgi:hypothetical protein
MSNHPTAKEAKTITIAHRESAMGASQCFRVVKTTISSLLSAPSMALKKELASYPAPDWWRLELTVCVAARRKQAGRATNP